MFLASAFALPLSERIARFAHELPVWRPSPRHVAREVEIRNVALSATWAFAFAQIT